MARTFCEGREVSIQAVFAGVFGYVFERPDEPRDDLDLLCSFPEFELRLLKCFAQLV